jgi:transcriptional regulator with GAF, ATPase, and Fis domain
MELGLRVRLICDGPGGWLPRVNAGLRAHGLLADDGADAGPAPARPATLLLFDDLSPQVLNAVEETSRQGRDRTLAVATSRRALGDSGVWSLLRRGASDAFAWDDVDDPMAQVAARLERWNRIDALIETPAVHNHLIGTSPAWLACLRQIVELSAFSDGPVLLLGESGTGKELLARLVHAFTGAATARDGAFALADGGTLFLDEVGELPLTLQAQLLRVVQERTYKRVGANAWQRTNFRLICATHRDLRQDVAAGRFRADFYHRIASRICHLPPLNARGEDILPLAEHFLHAGKAGSACPGFDRAVARFLIDRAYPGNVRELRQLVDRIGDRHVGPGRITPGDVPEDEWASLADAPAEAQPGVSITSPGVVAFDDAIVQALHSGCNLREIARQATETAIRLALASENGNLQRAAKRLGVTDRALQLRRAQRAD